MLEKLACNLVRNDELPNIELAEELCRNDDSSGIAEIVGGLTDGTAEIANDCIKVLYEIGARKPQLISAYVDVFISSLSSRNNRIVWGAMTALATIAEETPATIFENLDALIAAYHKGSVITVDNAVRVFAKLAKVSPVYEKTLLPILLNHLSNCRAKELPQHAESSAICFNKANASSFIEIIKKRYTEFTVPQQRRIDKILKQLTGLKS